MFLVCPSRNLDGRKENPNCIFVFFFLLNLVCIVRKIRKPILNKLSPLQKNFKVHFLITLIDGYKKTIILARNERHLHTIVRDLSGLKAGRREKS